MSTLDVRVSELAEKYRPLAEEILKEAVRIPADYVDRPAEEGGDSLCGLSNHEGPRLEYLRRKIIEIGAVREENDVFVDEFGNLVWQVEDPNDEIEIEKKKVIYYDGHSDTVGALRQNWLDKLGGGIDAYNGLTDKSKVDKDFLRSQLGYVLPDDQWDNLIFGRGSADQLGGVISQVVAAKILIELTSEGSLKGVRIRFYATACEEDNDGCGPMFMVSNVFTQGKPELIPDVVILSEGTGDSRTSALGIYRGQRGRMQIEVDITGRSCHGSMPWEGLNPLEYGAQIIKEATKQAEAGFLKHPFLGEGTRTASDAKLSTPSDCAVPERFVFRFNRRITVGETPEMAVAEVENLAAISKAREAGLTVKVHVPTYDQPTWTGYIPNNPQIYMSWITPEEHPAIQAAVKTYESVVSPAVTEQCAELSSPGCLLSAEPRVDCWIFSTDGVGFPVRVDDDRFDISANKGWVTSGEHIHPPMFGIGPGFEQNTHKVGECVDSRELQHVVAFYARFPSLFASMS